MLISHCFLETRNSYAQYVIDEGCTEGSPLRENCLIDYVDISWVTGHLQLTVFVSLALSAGFVALLMCFVALLM